MYKLFGGEGTNYLRSPIPRMQSRCPLPITNAIGRALTLSLFFQLAKLSLISACFKPKKELPQLLCSSTYLFWFGRLPIYQITTCVFSFCNFRIKKTAPGWLMILGRTQLISCFASRTDLFRASGEKKVLFLKRVPFWKKQCLKTCLVNITWAGESGFLWNPSAHMGTDGPTNRPDDIVLRRNERISPECFFSLERRMHLRCFDLTGIRHLHFKLRLVLFKLRLD